MADHRTITRHAQILAVPIFDNVSQQCVKTESLGYFTIKKEQTKSPSAIAASPPRSKYVPYISTCSAQDPVSPSNAAGEALAAHAKEAVVPSRSKGLCKMQYFSKVIQFDS